MDNDATTVIPIMDVDSVTAGRGGKNQQPHDHNRDWSAQPHWKAVASAMSRLRTLNAQGRLELFMDVHDLPLARRPSRPSSYPRSSDKAR